MSDGLNHNERAWAWLASWNPSFEGVAIVNCDFTFRAVNQQFCDIVGVTPAEIINNSFEDITPQPLRDLDVKNAELVKAGLMPNYLLPKTYEFASGKRVDITLLVNGVYHPETEEFLFFVSKIMERRKITTSAAPSQVPTGLLEWMDKKKIMWGILTIMGATIAAMADKIAKWITHAFY